MTGTPSDQEVVDYLLAHPDFFQTYPELLRTLKVPHGLGGQAVSLVERQIELLREDNKKLALQQAQLLRFGRENETLDATLQAWMGDLLRCHTLKRLPETAVNALASRFSIPQLALRVWPTAARQPQWACAAAVDPEIMAFTARLHRPYCGSDTQCRPAHWLAAPGLVTRSIALVPLRADPAHPPVGLLVLGSPDPSRFTEGMGTLFLERIGHALACALARPEDIT